MEASLQNSNAELRDELRSDARTVADSTKERIHSEVDARKGAAVNQAQTLSSALENAANGLQDSPDWLRSAFEQGAQKLQSFAQAIERKDSRELTRDVQQLARENPGTFLAGCALAGFAAARVLKAGAETPGGQAAAGTASGSSGMRADPYDPYASSDANSPSAFSGMAGSSGQGASGGEFR